MNSLIAYMLMQVSFCYSRRASIYLNMLEESLEPYKPGEFVWVEYASILAYAA